jgi:acyl-CoA thioester hydrolase
LENEYPLWIEEQVRFSETDQLGHVNNTVFAVYFEVGRSTWFTRSGIYGQDRVTLVIVRTTIEFLHPILWPGAVRIGTRMSKSGRSSFDMEQVMLQESKLAGRAVSTMVLVDKESGNSVPMPDDVRAMLGL